MWRSFSLAALSLTLAACGGVTVPPTHGTAMTEANDGQTLRLKKDGVLIVTLVSNPTTGFQWTVDQIEAAYLKQQGEPDYVSDCPDGRPGCGGHQTFRFTAGGAGQTKLRLIYHRPFEKDKPPAQTFGVTINIQ